MTATTAETAALEREFNPMEAQAARFDLAAQKLNLEEGIWKVLRYPNREIILHIPVAMDNGTPGGVHRIPGAALDCARPCQGRHSLRARRDLGRSPRSGQLDDLEVRRRQYSLRRRQGRRHLRSAQNVRAANWSA